MKIDGGCLCGLITYEATIDQWKIVDLSLYGLSDQFRLGVPHCRWWASDDFRLLTGKLKSYIKTAQSGAKGRCPFVRNAAHISMAADAEWPQTFTCALARQGRSGN